jgi:subtilase family serine protease
VFEVAHFQLLAANQLPPTEANCLSLGRCFVMPTSMSSYNVKPPYDAGHEGHGVTIASIDSFGNPNMASDLKNFDNQMQLPHMCGERGITCTSSMPTITHVYFNGKTIGSLHVDGFR